MDLEIGSTYKNRKGEVRVIESLLSFNSRFRRFGFRVKDDKGAVYCKNGRCSSNLKRESPFDLVEKIRGKGFTNAWD